MDSRIRPKGKVGSAMTQRVPPTGVDDEAIGPMEISTQVPKITKPLASAHGMVNSGMMVVMHKTAGIGKSVDLLV